MFYGFIFEIEIKEIEQIKGIKVLVINNMLTSKFFTKKISRKDLKKLMSQYGTCKVPSYWKLWRGLKNDKFV
jgi:hypothetical protein